MMNDRLSMLEQAGARLGTATDFPRVLDFGAWEEEYRAALEKAALFDLSGLNVLRVHGKDHTDLLHRLSMNELRQMQPDDLLVNAFPDAKGKIVEAVFMVRRPDALELITGFQRGQSMATWLDRYIFIEDVSIDDITEEKALLLLVGPEADSLLSPGEARMHFTQLEWGGATVEVARVEGLLPNGILIRAASSDTERIYQHCLQLAAEKRLRLAGNRAFHALRVREGVPMHGHEFGEDANPYEAGLKRYISYTKGCYIGQEVIARLDTYDKVKYDYTGLWIDTREPLAAPLAVLRHDQEVGKVTSAAWLPDAGRTAAIARIRRKALEEGGAFIVRSGESRYEAEVRELAADAEK